MDEPTLASDGNIWMPPSLGQELPDVMNDSAFNPPPRSDTTASKSVSDHGSDALATCRICRSEGSDEEPLFHPCKCSGSIKFVHQDCLMEWLSHSHKKHCELCKTPFRFTKLYDAHMPAQLPWEVFIKRAFVHVGQGITSAGRGLLVGMVWMVILPWFIRWAWRWMFWLADAGWARERYLHQLKRASLANMVQQMNETASEQNPGKDSGSPIAYNMVKDFVNSFGPNWANDFSSDSNGTMNSPPWPQADTSVFSSWSYISEPTPNPGLNRMILDIFEGQLITCVVIIGFILVFLIREWVVQQQPLVNLDQLNDVQQRIRDATDRMNEENERFRRQQELLDQARRRLLEIQQAAHDVQESGIAAIASERPEFIGWERLEEVIDSATEMFRNADTEGFESQAAVVVEQIRAAGYVQDADLDAFMEKVYAKLTSYTGSEELAWENMLRSEIRNSKRSVQGVGRPGRYQEAIEGESQAASSTSNDTDLFRRPPMPDREFSSMATQVQRLLEEADAVFKAREARIEGTDGLDTQAFPNTATTATSSSSGSDPIATPASEQSLADKIAELSERLSEPVPGAAKYEIPVTNAGPDAKINIKRSGISKARAVPEPKTEEHIDENKKDEEDAPIPRAESETSSEGSLQDSSSVRSDGASSSTENQSESSNLHPFHPEGPPPPDQANEDSLTNRVASVFREEFGLDEAEAGDLRQAALTRQRAEETQLNDTEPEDSPNRQVEQQPKTYSERLVDWFWGDIHVPEAADPAPAAREERVQNGAAQEAPFVPVHDGQPAPDAGQQPDQQDELRDPEVAAAAAQAGLDAEAVEDAEDLEGIFELIGLQGPIAGLFQTSMFCLVLVIGTVLGAVSLPYHWGKAVLLIIGSPVYFIITMPLQIASFIADVVIDASLFAGGWAVLLSGLAAEVIYSALCALLPSFPSSLLIGTMSDAAMKTVNASGGRLQNLFAIEGDSSLGWNMAILSANVNAHASLRELQNEVDAVLGFIGRGIFSLAETLSSGSSAFVWRQLVSLAFRIPVLPAKFQALYKLCKQYVQPLLDALSTLKTGALTLPVPSSAQRAIDPSLVFWSSSDRFLTVLTGYAALALVAAAYVIADKPITRSPAGQRTEKQIRDTLRQAGGVLKVILIISIEMLVFPLYCGLLLDLAFLPLFEGASVYTRLAFAARKPYSFCFMHWFVGTCYMFHFALFVSMCRKILRKGVLWFIRDPDDPTFHPVRDVLERNVATQLRKIAFSALVYGALVILCLGGVIWTIGKVFKGIFPICWMSTEPVFEFPVDLLLYNFLTPVLFKLLKPSDAVHAMYAWWLRRCARILRLSHFLFDDRRKDEEGHHVYKTWSSFLLMRKEYPSVGATVAADHRLSDSSEEPEVYFQREGKYVLTPCSDQYRPPKAGEAFLHSDDEDVYITDKDGNRNEHFAKIYVPPLFRVRVTLFMVCLWMFSAFTGLCATLVPLAFGRRALAFVAPGLRVNDIYAYSIGAYTLGGLLFALLKGSQGFQHLRAKTRTPDLRAWLIKARTLTVRTCKCTYVYGFLGIALPTLFAFFLQFYLILPLHTYATASAARQQQNATASNPAGNTTADFNFNQTTPSPIPGSNGPWLASHSIHILQDYALGLLYVRLATRGIMTTPTSRIAEAFRRVTASGYVDPNTALFTRFFVLPTILLSLLIFLLPPLGAWITVSLGVATDETAKTLMYRYSYPFAAGLAIIGGGLAELASMTARWRARIRDEVYLVGERLHNFGEKRPPSGTRSVVRRD